MLTSLDINNLKRLEHVVTLSTLPMIKSMSEALKSGRELQPITVGKINDEYYILDGYARVEAHRLANISKIKADVIELKSREEAELWHIRLNVRSSLNILKLYEALKYHEVLKHNISALGLDETMLKILKRLDRIKGRAYSRLSYYLEMLKERFSRVPPIPYYVIVLISELEDEEMQEHAVDFAFINIEDKEDVFSYQDYDRMLSFIKILKNKDDKPDLFTSKARVKHYSSRQISIFTCKCGRKYTVGAKKGEVNEIEEHDNLIVVKGSDDMHIHTLPNEIVEALRLDTLDAKWYIVEAYKMIELLPYLKGKVAILATDPR